MSELAVGYIRVSTQDQDRQSPERQYKRIMEYLKDKKWKFKKEKLAEVEIELDDRVTGYTVKSDKADKKDYEILGFFTESGSGWKPDSREVFNTMVEYVREYKVKHIFFTWVSRLARNFEDYVELKKRLRKVNEDVHLHFVEEGLVFCPHNKEDWQGEDRLEDILRRGKAESGEKSARARRSRKDGFEEEKITYRLPFCYAHKVDPITRRPYVELIPEYAEMVKEGFRLVGVKGYTIYALADTFAEKGWQKPTYDRKLRKYVMRPFTIGYLYGMLENDAFVGRLKYKGETKQSSIVPKVVDQQLFDKVQKNLERRTRRKPREKMEADGKYKSPLDQVCRCSFCGCQIITETIRRPNNRVYHYMRCTNGRRQHDTNFYKKKFGQSVCIQPYYKEPEIEKVIDTQVSKLWMDEGLMLWLEEELKAIKTGSQKTADQVLKTLNDRLSRLMKRKETLNIMRADGEIDKEEFMQLKTETLEESRKVEDQIKEVSTASVNIEDEVEITIDLMDKLKRKWPGYLLSEKVEILRIMTKKIELGKGTQHNSKEDRKAVNIKWNMPWDMLVKYEDALGGDDIGSGNVHKQNKWHTQQDSNLRPSDS